MKNKFEKDFFESRDAWWSIQDQIENDAAKYNSRIKAHYGAISL